MANQAVRSLGDMLAGLSPVLIDTTYFFVSFPGGQVPGIAADTAIGSFREAEGVSLIVPCETALALGCADGQPMRHIRLEVHSSLEGIGLTAAVAGRLAEHGIACNVVAAFHHDHLFVPAGQAEEALDLLLGLQSEAG